MAKKYNPDKEIGQAVKDLLTRSKDQPFDMQIKAINTAIAWEKCKYAASNDDDEFDSEAL